VVRDLKHPETHDDRDENGQDEVLHEIEPRFKILSFLSRVPVSH
jgi:hypothetical protein